jgi:hypothetical protein
VLLWPGRADLTIRAVFILIALCFVAPTVAVEPLCVIKETADPFKERTEGIEHIATALGIAAAGVFFLYKAFAGYQVVNLDLQLTLERRLSNQLDTDWLKVDVLVSKGDRGTLELHDAKVRVYRPGMAVSEEPLVGVARLSALNFTAARRVRRIVKWEPSADSPFLNLTPGEKTSLGCFLNVHSGAAYVVEAVVIGRRMRSSYLGQWRASTTSLPPV